MVSQLSLILLTLLSNKTFENGTCLQEVNITQVFLTFKQIV